MISAPSSFPWTWRIISSNASLWSSTDGVADVQNAQGQLFGFERTAESMRHGAAGAALAEAAQNFGQQDDITVLTRIQG